MTFEEILEHLRQAQGDPHLLALATTDSVLASHPPALRQALEAAAIPHWFDEQILGQMMNVDPAAASAVLATLKTLPFVEPFQAKGGWNVHEATRLALRRKLRSDEPERFAILSATAAGVWIGDDSGSRVENIYHRLSASPQKGAGDLERT